MILNFFDENLKTSLKREYLYMNKIQHAQSNGQSIVSVAKTSKKSINLGFGRSGSEFSSDISEI